MSCLNPSCDENLIPGKVNWGWRKCGWPIAALNEPGPACFQISGCLPPKACDLMTIQALCWVYVWLSLCPYTPREVDTLGGRGRWDGWRPSAGDKGKEQRCSHWDLESSSAGAPSSQAVLAGAPQVSARDGDFTFLGSSYRSTTPWVTTQRKTSELPSCAFGFLC